MVARANAGWWVVVCCFFAWLAFGCRSSEASPSAEGARDKPSEIKSSKPVPKKPRPKGVSLSNDVVVGAPKTFGRLQVFPVRAHKQERLDEMVSLEQAMAKGQATVREVDASGSVGTLVVENHGKLSIFIVAGTILKGGKQDRQVGQDFVVGPKRTAQVDAFCVERGRWDDSRDGQQQQGRFRVFSELATPEVRAAGQYDQDQGKVWRKVAKTNHHHKHAPTTGTLLATLEDKTIIKKREALALQVTSYLKQGAHTADTVGFAYAIDGEVVGARWFGNRQLYQLFEDKLVRAAALQTLSTPVPKGRRKPSQAADVKRFVTEVERTQVSDQRTTAAENTNEYKRTTRSYGSKTMLRTAQSPAAKPAVRAVSQDYSKSY